MQFVLASQSPARLALLRSAGLDPAVFVSGVDEDAVAASLTDPSPPELVAALATAKAEAVLDQVAAAHPDAVVVACDSMLNIGGQMVGKPASPDIARQRWAAMAGTSGELLTGHAVVRLDGGTRAKETSGWESTSVRFGTPSAEEIDAYVATGEPLHVAGGFTIDGLGSWFVDGLDGGHTSVIGISLPLTRRLLAEVGVSVVDLWRRPGS
ncbi:nucleoside triphosphate pyrophosphatase [Amycolatopsis mongoliensis]|uniref:Nucleoside triphosphate pyrophosphatase n=1 Tax=Amycolatopsis mongoliensis TaxID=715475 RepID=A0A9Y2JRR8_9PSEU|nr:nucleoside triphosphate pyrophosphatase [Amycolatopsis sp. 4-36]WIY03521.1 nucleoside triphosphate pyrophosphatase [Amycolatopsis sp. 4-36]